LRGHRAFLIAVCVPALLAGGCASLPPNGNKPVSRAFDQAEETALGRALSAAYAAHPGRSGFEILDTGRQALQARLALIEAAQRSLDLQYYIWNSDASGSYMARRVLLAADRGVRVRLLLDDVNVGGRDPILAALDVHPLIEVRIFNPNAGRDGPGKTLSLLGDLQRLNRRMHNKTFVADGAAGIVGGRNIGDEYFDLHAESNFRDRDLLAVGPIVREISANFDVYWNSPLAYPVSALQGERLEPEGIGPALVRARERAGDATALREAPPGNAPAGLARIGELLPLLIWAEAELVYDPPMPEDAAGNAPKATARALGAVVQAARREVLVESAYLILGEPQLDNVRALTARGVAVRALTNSLATNDLTANHAGYARTRRRMLESGMELFEFRPDATSCRDLVGDAGRCGAGKAFALHAKSVVIDREVLYVGSFNVNLRSVYFNSETVLIVRSPELAAQVAGAVEVDMRPGNSWRVLLDGDGRLAWDPGEGNAVLRHEPDTSWWRRFKVKVIGLLPLEKYY
jgi:putative cardiolipin synthase